MKKLLAIALGSLFLTCNGAQADQVIADDLIVQGSLCTGFDCVINESFGFDTIRLKENNTRIKFEDTSTGTFPSNDWQLTANDSASGGSNKFSIEDITGAKVPFTITAGAATNSIFVDSTGRVGLRTSTPVLDLHLQTSNTPGIRLEQTNAGGFTAQTWDVAGNEANFFVRDVTGGSHLPFRIRPGAPTSSIDIAASGNVGIGTASPSKPMHISRSNGTAGLLVEETGGVSGQALIEMKNNAAVRLYMRNTGVTQQLWAIRHNGNFQINTNDDSTVEFSLASTGDLTIGGALTQNSDVDSKENFEPINGQEILDKLTAIPITKWNYKDNDDKIRHLGPMAQDFYARFGLGADEKGISTLDMGGVALAGIQQLNKNLREKDNEIAKLEARIADLEALVQKLALNATQNNTLALARQ